MEDQTASRHWQVPASGPRIFPLLACSNSAAQHLGKPADHLRSYFTSWLFLFSLIYFYFFTPGSIDIIIFHTSGSIDPGVKIILLLLLN